MGTPDSNTATSNVDDSQNQPSFADQVNQAVKDMTFDETKQVWNLPEDLSEEVKFAATSEKRRRDTQASFTKSQQQVKALEGTNTLLQEEVKKSLELDLTPEQTEELEELKVTDPEAWRRKLNDYEQQAVSVFQDKLSTTYTEADKQAELSRRGEVLAEFLAANPEIKLNDDILANDVPPRITKQLENGEVSFEQFLENVKDHLGKPGVAIANEEVPGGVNLSNVGGGAHIDPMAIEEDSRTSYKNEVY